MKSPQRLAIIGPTASGKTSLALMLARENHGVILSLDSLALYRDIEIASAKPTPQERGDIPHFGIDLIAPDEPFDVTRFIESYHQADAHARQHDRPLIIVGGSGFYLKTLLEGISPLPAVTDAVSEHLDRLMRDLAFAYTHLRSIDPSFAHKITPSDRYRIEKGLRIYYASGEAPSRWFETHPPQPVITESLPIYEVSVARPLLRERINLRTKKMLREGLIDEVCSLEHTYTRTPNAMKAIGIVEVLGYLDGLYSYAQLGEAISLHTAQLAKRQVTFNKSQFLPTQKGELGVLKKALLG